MELRRRAIKRWVPCGDMDRRLKIPHAAKVVCGFRKPSEECLSLAPLRIGFDWSSSYNTIQYNSIINKAKLLFKSYLKNRKQFVQIGNVKSTMKQVLTGVSQGSIIGPLFLIYRLMTL